MNTRGMLALSCACVAGVIAGVVAGYGYANRGSANGQEREIAAPAAAPMQLSSSVRTHTPAPPLVLDIERAQPGFQRSRLAYQRASELSAAEIATLVPAVHTTSSPARTVVLAVLLQRWIELDHTAAVQFLQTQLRQDDPAYGLVFAAGYRAWLELDHTQAINFARTLDTQQRDHALRLAMEWASERASERNGEGKLAEQLFTELSSATQLALNEMRTRSLTPAAAFTASLRYDDPEQRFELTQRAFVRWLQEDPAAALAQLERIPADERDAIAATALAQWAGRMPEQAWQHIHRGDLPTPYRAAMLGALAEHNPQQALAWLQQDRLQRSDARAAVDLYRAALPSLLRADLNAAAQAVAELRGDAPLDLIQQVAGEYAQRDARQMYAWAANLAHRSDYEYLQTLQAVSATLVAANPNAAIAYVDHADERTRGSLLKEIANYKAAQNVRSGWEWLNRYSEDSSYRENARALLGQWSYVKPAEVGDVVRGIADTELQRALAEQLAAVWRERDHTAFRTWAATLSPDLRAALLSESGS